MFSYASEVAKWSTELSSLEFSVSYSNKYKQYSPSSFLPMMSTCQKGGTCMCIVDIDRERKVISVVQELYDYTIY